MQTRSKRAIRTGAALLLLAAGTALAQPALQEERIHPGEVVFESGKPYTYAGGDRQALRTRTESGETIYYRMVRYDDQLGYLDAQGQAAPLSSSTVSAASTATPLRYDGGGLSRPDFYNSPYNRDARQRFQGPSYFGSCSRYDGCRGVEYVPLVPVVVPLAPDQRGD